MQPPRGTDFKWGGRAPLVPPLVTALLRVKWNVSQLQMNPESIQAVVVFIGNRVSSDMNKFLCILAITG